MSLPIGLRAWRVLTSMASPFARLLLRRRATRDKEDWTRLNERLGMAGLARPEGRLVWIHGASVGESLSALPLIEKLQASAPFPNAERILAIDGVRAEYADGFGLARASNTTPVIVLRFEADNPAALARIQGEFRRVLEAAKPGIALPF